RRSGRHDRPCRRDRPLRLCRAPPGRGSRSRWLRVLLRLRRLQALRPHVGAGRLSHPELDYDPERRCTRVVNGEGESTVYRYDERGVVNRIERGTDFYQHTRYDALGSAVARGSGRGIVVSFEYDDAGRIRTATDGEGNAQAFEYNDFGQVTR